MKQLVWRVLRPLLPALSLAALSLATLTTAQAANLQVAPILLEFAPAEQAQSIWLSNSGNLPLRAQVRVLAWSQPNNADQLDATRELVASPPAVDIAPGEKQLVRIIRLQTAAPAQERTFRLIIDELPVAAAPGTPKPPGLQFLLRHSVPVFVGVSEPQPATGKPSDISALTARFQADGTQAIFSVKNAGNQRVKISQLVYVDAEGRRSPLSPGLLGYVLAGQQMQWPLTLPASVTLPASGTLKAKFNADQEEQNLPLAENRP